jgi:glycosyltransferase involved in cell wall biosynthesis
MSNKSKPILYLVIPCLNEVDMVYTLIEALDNKYKQLISNKIIDNDSKILFIDDGSKDQTWNEITKASKNNNIVNAIKLSRNFGQQNALLAGLMSSKDKADVVITMDADMQDNIDLIDQMIDKYKKGNEIVYGVRSSRNKDTWLKRNTSKLFYNVMRLLGSDIIDNHAEYRLVTKKVIEELEKFKEVNLFLRGIFPLIGFNYACVYYAREKRKRGNSKYSLKKMLSFAWEGITSFSVRPLKLIFITGTIILLISTLIMFYALVQKCMGKTVAGWAFLTISIWFLGGLQMFSIGIIGEYVGKVYKETKQRPRYIISDKID